MTIPVGDLGGPSTFIGSQIRRRADIVLEKSKVNLFIPRTQVIGSFQTTSDKRQYNCFFRKVLKKNKTKANLSELLLFRDHLQDKWSAARVWFVRFKGNVTCGTDSRDNAAYC